MAQGILRLCSCQRDCRQLAETVKGTVIFLSGKATDMLAMFQETHVPLVPMQETPLNSMGRKGIKVGEG